jgi:hypothetical protein
MDSDGLDRCKRQILFMIQRIHSISLYKVEILAEYSLSRRTSAMVSYIVFHSDLLLIPSALHYLFLYALFLGYSFWGNKARSCC